MAAASQELATAELLEMILLNLSPRDLLLLQRVCSTWRYSLKSSIRVQRALFRRPQPPAKQPEDTPPSPRCANPFLPRPCRGDNSLSGWDIYELDIPGLREMYVCQPPVQRLEIFGRLSGNPTNHQRRKIVKTRGVKVKHLVRCLKKMPGTRGFKVIVGSRMWRRVPE